MSSVDLRVLQAWLCILDASRTSGERRATIMVGDAIKGAACIAVPLI